MINEARDTLNRAVPHIALGLMRPRGLLMPLDPWMRGDVRFARKVGGQGSVWLSDIKVETVAPSGGGEALLFVDEIWEHLTLESIITINNVKNRVIDFDRSTVTTSTVILQNVLESRIESGQAVYLWAFPVTVEGGMVAGSTALRVSSPYQLGRGDRLELPNVVGAWDLTTPLDVSAVDLVEIDTEGYKYILNLATPVPRNVASNETVYMRAFPGYFSGNMPLPLFSAAYLNVVGPFLLDFMSGPLVTGVSYDEFMSVKTLRADGTPLTPDVSVGSHNVQINSMPIRADQFLFWNLLKGTIDYDGLNTVAQLDDAGEWRISFRMAPHLDVPGSYAAGSIWAVAKADLQNNETVTVSDGIIEVKFEFKVDGTYVRTAGLTTIDVSSVTTEQEVAWLIGNAINSAMQLDITLVLASLANNDIITLFDGAASKVFEFKIDGTYVPADASYVTVDVSAAVTDDDAADALAAAIETWTTNAYARAVGGATGIVWFGNLTDLVSLQATATGSGTTVGDLAKLGLSASVNEFLVRLVNRVAGAAGDVAITDTVSHVDFTVSGMTGGSGGLKWIIPITANGDGNLMVRFYPNADQVFPFTAATSSVEVEVYPNDDPVTLIDFRIASEETSVTQATEVRFRGWQLNGSRASQLEASVVVQTDSEHWAGSALYLKPLWPNVDLLRTRTDDHEMNSHSLIGI